MRVNIYKTYSKNSKYDNNILIIKIQDKTNNN